jgi:shikimate dehydrogenase
MSMLHLMWRRVNDGGVLVRKRLQLAVIGNPISHSMSPELHQQFAQQVNLSIDYQKLCAPLDRFRETVDAFRASGGSGANVTIPFKIEAFEYADTRSERAIRTGTANTLIFKDALCIADNTDGIGFIRDIAQRGFTLQDKKIMIIGAGGAARGILGEIIREKPQKIIIKNRTKEKAESLIDFYRDDFRIELFSTMESVDLIINASAMDFSQDDFNPKLSNTFCYDLNYGARHTPFLDWARKNGAKKIVDGFGMLIEQGAESFFQWTRRRV